MRTRLVYSTLLLGALVVLCGCAQVRRVTISAKPPDAVISVDGVERGRGPIQERFTFNRKTDVFRVTASRLGFKDQTIAVTQDMARDNLVLELRPQSKRVTFNVQPAPAVLSANGKVLAPEPVGTVSVDLDFTVDGRNQWNSYTIVAERVGFAPAQVQVNWTDRDTNYVLNLEPLRKDLAITSNPPGATVYLDGELLGNAPLKDISRPFPVDLATNQIKPRILKAVKPGYDPVEVPIGWDDGRENYVIDLSPKTKTVRISTNPPGARVLIDGKDAPRDSAGGSVAAVATLQFPPVTEKGDLRTYQVEVSARGTDGEWYPEKFVLGWDDGREAYDVRLREVMTRQVPLLAAELERDASGWVVVGRARQVKAWKDTTEGSRSSPIRMTSLPPGSSIGSLGASPDGNQLIFTLLNGTDKPGDLRSQMLMVKTDGTGGAENVTDGRTLDLTPAFTPAGDRIVFSSNRGGKRLNIWSMSASGAPGITRMTSGDSHDLWPSIDSDPKPRLFYQSMVDTRGDARLYMTQVGTIFQTELSQLGGTQPRVSPKNDAVVFCVVNERTGKRDIYRMSDTGESPENLTNTPDVDECDPVWSKDGSRLAFASDRAVDAEQQHNYDIWIMDLSDPANPVQLTTNGSHDDMPAWDPSGYAVYFRSNRGGVWNVWKLGWR
jgi:hypothetical protein